MMADKIDGFRQPGIPAPSTRSTTGGAGVKGTQGDPSGSTAVGTDRVHVTDEARRIQKLEAELAALSDVDDARVAEVTKRIAEGRFEVDADHLADRFLSTEKDLR